MVAARWNNSFMCSGLGDRISTFYSGYLEISGISIEGSGAAKLAYYGKMIGFCGTEGILCFETARFVLNEMMNPIFQLWFVG